MTIHPDICENCCKRPIEVMACYFTGCWECYEEYQTELMEQANG